MASVVQFSCEVILGCSYKLVAMVRPLGSHFSYAVNRNNENWILINDLQDTFREVV